MQTTAEAIQRALARETRIHEAATAKKNQVAAHRAQLRRWGREIESRHGVDCLEEGFFSGDRLAAKRCVMEALLAFGTLSRDDATAAFGMSVTYHNWHYHTDCFTEAVKALEAEGLPVHVQYGEPGRYCNSPFAKSITLAEDLE